MERFECKNWILAVNHRHLSQNHGELSRIVHDDEVRLTKKHEQKSGGDLRHTT